MAKSSVVTTFLFTDIVGSTQLTDTLGDEGAQEIVRLHNRLIRTEVARAGGSEVKAMGDGFMIAFRSVTSAIACAVAVQRTVIQHNHENPTLEFHVRMGLNAGEAIAEEDDFFGAAVIVAARISALAGAGDILVSAGVKQLAQGMRGVQYEYKGEFQLKGIREAHQVHQVIYSQAPEAGQAAALKKPRFVGREREMEALSASLEQVAAGSGLFVLLDGESGVGKTRLAEEFARQARSRGFRVWRGRCYGTEGAPPYAPFLEALRTYVQELPDEVLLDELGEDAQVLARLLPEISRRVPVGADPVPVPPEQERYRLMDAVSRLVGQVARRRPLLMLIDDVHWADPASCVLLRHLGRTLAKTPALLLSTSTEDLTDSPLPIGETVGEFARLQLYRRVTLRGIEAADVRELLVSAAGREPPERLVGALREQTEGNPFFLIEIVSHLHSEGKLLTPEGEWRRELEGGALDVPESVRVIVQRRVGSLSEDARKALTIAAVAGRDFSYDLLDGLGEIAPDALLDALDEGINAGMIEEREGAAARFRFSHQLTRQTLYEGLSGLRRQRYHLQIGEALENLIPAEVEEIAYHLSEAGRMAPAAKTRDYLVRAGDKAGRAAAWEDAARHYKAALAIAGLSDEERAAVLRSLGAAEGGAGEWEAAVGTLNEAMTLFEQLNDGESAGWTAYSLRRLYGARGQFQEAAAIVERGLQAVGEADSEGRSRLLAQAAFGRSAFGESDEAERLLGESMSTAERLDNAAAKGFSAFIRGMHYMNYSRMKPASEWLGRSAGWALEGNDPWTASQASSFRRHINFTLGELAEAERALDEEERLARKAGNFLAVCETKWIACGIALLRARPAEAEANARVLLELIEASHADSGIPGALINLSYARFLQGDRESHEALLAKAVEVYERMSAAPIDDPRPVLVLLRALAGDRAGALALLPQMERYFEPEEHWTTSSGEARATLAAALVALGEKEKAAALYGPLKEWARSAGYVVTGASSIPQLVSRVLAMIAGAAQMPDAEEHFQRAVEEAARLDATTELAEANYWHAVYLHAGGRDAEARERLAEAAGIWEEAELRAPLARVQALLDEIGEG